MWLLSLSSLSCGNTVRGSDRLFTVLLFNRCAESSMTQPSMISIMANFGNICICFFFLVTTTLALHHDWDVEISRCKKQEQDRNMSFLFCSGNKLYKKETFFSAQGREQTVDPCGKRWTRGRCVQVRSSLQMFLCETFLVFLRNKRNLTSDTFRTTSPHEDTVRMESNNNVAALLHRVNY